MKYIVMEKKLYNEQIEEPIGKKEKKATIFLGNEKETESFMKNKKQSDFIVREYPWYHKTEANLELETREGESELRTIDEECINIHTKSGIHTRPLKIEGMPRHDKIALESIRAKKTYEPFVYGIFELDEISKLEGWWHEKIMK